MTAPAISASLTSLINFSILQGCFPTELKEANLTPVPKAGDKQSVKNYRPVSVIPVVAKVFEAIVHQQLYYFLERHNILKEEQTCFRPNRCTQDILKTKDDWKISLDQGKIVATVMIDLSKAFDTINHNLLLKKLDVYGVRGLERLKTISLEGSKEW